MGGGSHCVGPHWHGHTGRVTAPGLDPSLTPRSCHSQVHVYDPYDDDYYQTVPLDSHQTAYISSGHYGHQYGGGWPHPAAQGCWPDPDSPHPSPVFV